jgi:RNA 2',3'-cyclic 3'-phosphodiesterase
MIHLHVAQAARRGGADEERRLERISGVTPMISSETRHGYRTGMPRLFVALLLPPALIAALRPIQTAPFTARWQSAAQLHLTLAFLGDVAERDLAAVDVALSAIAAPAMPIALAGVGHFAERGRANSLWAGIAPREPVAALAAKVAEACRRAGCPPDARRFVPHITVARLRMDETAVVPWLIANGSLTSGPEVIDRFGLYRSDLRSDGSRYELLADYRAR